MKKIITLLLLAGPLAAFAQTKTITQAIITTKTTVVAPEDDESGNVNTTTTGANGEEIRMVRFGGDGETKTTTWLKNDLVKTVSESEMGINTAYRDNAKKLTTTIMEVMGRKFGFYATDEDQAIIRKRMDSMMQRNGAPGPGPAASSFDISYVDENKKISGYDCKKALIVTTRTNGKKDTTVTWYIPGIKLQGINNTGGAMAGMGGMGAATGNNGFDKLDGFPMQYERTLNRGRKMTVVVTKLVTDKEVDDKEFALPKDVEIKAAKDMENGGGPGMMQIRIGG